MKGSKPTVWYLLKTLAEKQDFENTPTQHFNSKRCISGEGLAVVQGGFSDWPEFEELSWWHEGLGFTRAEGCEEGGAETVTCKERLPRHAAGLAWPTLPSALRASSIRLSQSP